MQFAPHNLKYPGLTKLVNEVGFDAEDNHWDKVYDFSAEDESLPTPHWSIMPMFERKVFVHSLCVRAFVVVSKSEWNGVIVVAVYPRGYNRR